MPLIKFCFVALAFSLTQNIGCTKYDAYSWLSNPDSENKNINDNFALNVSNNKHSNSTVRSIPIKKSTGKKWQVGRISRKHFEIINMLWRKTNIFNDVENTSPRNKKIKKSPPSAFSITPKHHKPSNNNTPKQPKKHKLGLNKPSPPVFQLSTMSFIEFYYLDEYPDSSTMKQEKTKNTAKNIDVKLAKFGNFRQRSPLFSFQFHNPAFYKPKPDTYLFEKLYAKPEHTSNMPKTTKIEPNILDTQFLQHAMVRRGPLTEHPETKIEKRDEIPVEKKLIKKRNSTSQATTLSIDINSTIANDKIKFFEMYDSNTRFPGKVLPEDVQIANTTYMDNEVTDNKQILLEQMDKEVGHGPNKIRYVKKHVESLKDIQEEVESTTRYTVFNVTFLPPKSTPVTFIEKETRRMMETLLWDVSLSSNISRPVRWSKYPFAAVYVYERFQVHCDAATISSHWLVASASCLSRHREDPNGEDRSAFVSYCGESWWNPERITYVRYTLLHPRFHPTEVLRRNMYNIGVIQVVASMSLSCPNWAPISTMSHQYVAELEGTIGSAIGWGLDRYDTTYASSDLPRHPLSVYEALLYSNNCPGNKYYTRDAETLAQEAAKNVYCLSLPPYAGEDRDPVHGGLLLVGGKLIALYLQEERRRWGEQSAQYTGIWRLIPWVHEVAKEPEEIDFAL